MSGKALARSLLAVARGLLDGLTRDTQTISAAVAELEERATTAQRDADHARRLLDALTAETRALGAAAAELGSLATTGRWTEEHEAACAARHAEIKAVVARYRPPGRVE